MKKLFTIVAMVIFLSSCSSSRASTTHKSRFSNTELGALNKRLDAIYHCTPSGSCGFNADDESEIHSLQAKIKEAEGRQLVALHEDSFAEAMKSFGVKPFYLYSAKKEKEDLRKIAEIMGEVKKRNRYSLDRNKFGVGDRHENVIHSYDALVKAQKLNMPLGKFKRAVAQWGGRVIDFDWDNASSIHNLKLVFDCETTMYLMESLFVRAGINPQQLQDVSVDTQGYPQQEGRGINHAVYLYYSGVQFDGKKYGSGDIYIIEQISFPRMAKDRATYSYMERRRSDYPLSMTKKFSFADDRAIHEGKKVWVKITNGRGEK